VSGKEKEECLFSRHCYHDCYFFCHCFAHLTNNHLITALYVVKYKSVLTVDGVIFYTQQ